jgi:hypothetical protein
MTAIAKRDSGYSMQPANFSELMKFAEMVAASDLAPKDYRGKAGNVVIAFQLGHELGLQPLQALQSVSVINGKATVWGDAALALVLVHPDYVSHSESIEGEGDARKGVFKIVRRGAEEHVQEFSVADAKKAQLWGKQGPWSQYPDRMLKLRARGFALRDKFADALKGMWTREEVEDFQTEEKARAVHRPAIQHEAKQIDANFEEPPVSDELSLVLLDIETAQDEPELRGLASKILALTAAEQATLRQPYRERLEELRRAYQG